MLLNRTTTTWGSARPRKLLLQAVRDCDAAFIRAELSANPNLAFDLLRVTRVDQLVRCMPDWTPDIALLSLDPRHRAAIEILENYCSILGRIPTIVIAPVADRVCHLLASRAGACHCIDIRDFTSRRLGRILKDAIWRLPAANGGNVPGRAPQPGRSILLPGAARSAPGASWPPVTRLPGAR